MATTRQATSEASWPAQIAPIPALTPADASHQDVPSPAILLQNRLGAALAASSNTQMFEPVIDKWSGATRLAVMFGGASASWLLVWQIADYLI